MTDEFKVDVRLHQGTAISLFLFSMMSMERPTGEVMQESAWTVMFADD